MTPLARIGIFATRMCIAVAVWQGGRDRATGETGPTAPTPAGSVTLTPSKGISSFFKPEPPRNPAVMTIHVFMEAVKNLAEERALLTKRWPSTHKSFPATNDPTNYNKIAAIWMQLGYAEALSVKPGVCQQILSQVLRTRVSGVRPKALQQEASESLRAEYVNKLKMRAIARTRASTLLSEFDKLCAYQCNSVCYVNNTCC